MQVCKDLRQLWPIGNNHILLLDKIQMNFIVWGSGNLDIADFMLMFSAPKSKWEHISIFLKPLEIRSEDNWKIFPLDFVNKKLEAFE